MGHGELVSRATSTINIYKRRITMEILYLVHQSTDELGLKDVAQRDPVQEAQQRLQSGVDQRCILGILLKQNRDRKGSRGAFWEYSQQ